ncbi:MAG: hypothetical protein LUE64_03635 [Candidatus Gastranaerophilales bacterium]|nr:hypothetical protein [Candidatus Gastranaerophilales bacterium]
MTSDVSSLLSQIQSYIKTDSDGNTTYSLSDVSKLETLFEDTDYYNAGETGQSAIQDQIDDLEKVIKTLQAEADELGEQIDLENLDVDKKCDELADIVSDINSETAQYQSDVKKAAQLAAKEAIKTYSESNGSTSFEECFSEALGKKMIGTSGISMTAIANLYDDYDTVKNEISNLSNTIQGLLDDVNALQNKLNLTNSTINLLTTTKNNMSDTIEGAYSNCDTDSKIPVYSGAKAELADKLLGTYTSRYDSDVTGGTSSSTEITEAQQELMDKWLAQKGDADYTSGDKYNVATNPELANLRSLYESGMIEELSASGLNADQILTFISENWDVGISKDTSTGNWKIPKGHSADAWVSEGVYTALSDLVASGTTAMTADDVNQTQMEELKKAVEQDDIITEMYNAGYSFKEAMYLLTQLFPDAGITYNLSEQSEEKGYGIVTDSSSSGSLYSTIAAQILEYWDVASTTTQTTDDSTTGETISYDPITFQSGSTTYTFITDRDGDGTFDYTDGSNNELLGSANGIQELLDYDYNGDGVIDDNDITYDEDGNALTITEPDGTVRYRTALDDLTLMANNQIENYDGTTNSVDFDVTYTSAKLAGITSINLSSILASENTTGTGDEISSSTKTYDNVNEGSDLNDDGYSYDDINGSSVINSFTISLSDGSTVTANETLNTEDNLNTFYKQIADNNTASIYSSISESEFADATAADNWATDEAEALGEQLNNWADSLAELAEKANVDGDRYKLNYDYEELEELYGQDGKSGTYIKTVISRGAAAAESYANQAKHKTHDLNELQSNAATAVDKEIDAINEEVEVVQTVEETEE